MSDRLILRDEGQAGLRFALTDFVRGTLGAAEPGEQALVGVIPLGFSVAESSDLGLSFHPTNPYSRGRLPQG